MRTRGASRAPHRPQDRSALHERAFRDVDPLEMHVERIETLAVVEGDETAPEEVVSHQSDPAAVRGHHGGARGRGEVHAGVRRAWLAVDDAAEAEAVGLDVGGDGAGESTAPKADG